MRCNGYAMERGIRRRKESSAATRMSQKQASTTTKYNLLARADFWIMELVIRMIRDWLFKLKASIFPEMLLQFARPCLIEWFVSCLFMIAETQESTRDIESWISYRSRVSVNWRVRRLR